MWNTLKQMVWRWTLRQIRALVWLADEWIHAQELKLHEPAAAAPVVVSDEFNVAKSAVREKAHKRIARAVRPRLARLKYAGGAWERLEAPRWTDSQRELAQD